MVTFERVAIGAILCTVGTLVYERGLPGFRKEIGWLDHHLADDHVLVSVRVTRGLRRSGRGVGDGSGVEEVP